MKRLMWLILAFVIVGMLWSPGGRVAEAQEGILTGFTSMLGALNIEPSGDLFWLRGGFAVGGGVKLATFYDGIVHVRASGVPSFLMTKGAKGSGSFLGLGAGVDLKELVEHFADKTGAAWVAKITPSIGATLLANLNGAVSVRPALYMTALKYPLD